MATPFQKTDEFISIGFHLQNNLMNYVFMNPSGRFQMKLHFPEFLTIKSSHVMVLANGLWAAVITSSHLSGPLKNVRCSLLYTHSFLSRDIEAETLVEHLASGLNSI